MAAVILKYVFLAIFGSFFMVAAGIQNVRLILPAIVRAGTSATLLCLYDLNQAPLYSVKWYRGTYEFYRYVPRERPSVMVFEIPGISVDVLTSNKHQVTLKNIPEFISGEISCEVTADAPSFTTTCVSALLTVIDIDVELRVSKPHYQLGETVVANCSSSSSIADSKLTFHINSRRVPDVFVKQTSHDFATLKLFLTPELGIHDKEFQLRCSAFLDNMYYVTSKATAVTISRPTNRSSSVSSRAPKTQFSIDYAFIFILFLYCLYRYY